MVRLTCQRRGRLGFADMSMLATHAYDNEMYIHHKQAVLGLPMNTDDKWMYVHTHNSKTWIYKGVRRAQFHLNNAVIYTCFRSAKEIKDDSSPMLLTYITNKQGTKGLVMGSASISHLRTGGRIILVLFSTPLSLGRSVRLIDVFWLHILTNR